MNCFYPNILNSEDCAAIAKETFSLYKENKLEADPTPYTNGSVGTANLPSTLKPLPKIEEIIKKDYGENIKFENTFVRIYQTGNDLKIHTDRPGLDITLTICVFSSAETSWPIHVSDTIVDGLWATVADMESCKDSYKSYETPVGSGVACLGTKSPHWRDILTIPEGQMIVQVFYHWCYVN